MQARLFCRAGETKGELRFATEATIGRDPDNALVLTPKQLAAHHARIIFESSSSSYVLEDLGSATGTELDGERISGPERLGHLHVITFAGVYDFVFQDLERCAARHGAAPSAAADEADTKDVPPALPVVPAPLPAAGGRIGEDTSMDDEMPLEVPSFLNKPVESGERTMLDDADLAVPTFLKQPVESGERTMMDEMPLAVPSFLNPQGAADVPSPPPTAPAIRCYVVLSDSEGAPRRILLNEGDNLVGRDIEAVVRLESASISRRHAILSVEAGRVTVRDAGSRNHTYLDDTEVEGTVEVPAKGRLLFGAVGAWLDIERR